MSRRATTRASRPDFDREEEAPGARLRAHRERLGLSIRAAGQRCGVSHGTIQNVEARGLDGRSFEVVAKIARGYGVAVADLHRISRGVGPAATSAAHDPGPDRLHPSWVALPVYSVVGAGLAGAAPLDRAPALVPREHLSRRGASVETTRAYVLDGDCLVSPEALHIERRFAPGDYVAVDVALPCGQGDVVIAWWPARCKLVIQRFAFETVDLALSPIAAGRSGAALPSVDDLRVVGPLVWRGG